MSKKFYAGIGARGTPIKVRSQMGHIARELGKQDYWLRSGNAEGADQAFAKGVDDEKAQIWLPWHGFQSEFSDIHPDHTYKLIQPYDEEAWDSIITYHPKGPSLGHKSRCFMARNYRQVRGSGESDSQFIICWTTDGKEVGGTAQAMRVARDYGIPIYNLWDMTPEEILQEIEKLNLIN